MTDEAPKSEEVAPNLTIQDLISIAQLIELASSRAAYKPAEFVTVGTIYTKLIAFLQSAGAINQAAPTGTNEEN